MTSVFLSGSRLSLRETAVYDQISQAVEEESKPPKVFLAFNPF